MFPLSALVLHYWTNASIFKLGDIEPFLQPNWSYCSFKLQFDVCDNKVVIAANIHSTSKTYILLGLSPRATDEKVVSLFLVSLVR